MPTLTKTRIAIPSRLWTLFRDWLDEREITTEGLAQAVPYLTYSTASKWRSRTNHPTHVNRAVLDSVASVFPDCPLVKVNP